MCWKLPASPPPTDRPQTEQSYFPRFLSGLGGSVGGVPSGDRGRVQDRSDTLERGLDGPRPVGSMLWSFPSSPFGDDAAAAGSSFAVAGSVATSPSFSASSSSTASSSTLGRSDSEDYSETWSTSPFSTVRQPWSLPSLEDFLVGRSADTASAERKRGRERLRVCCFLSSFLFDPSAPLRRSRLRPRRRSRSSLSPLLAFFRSLSSAFLLVAIACSETGRGG